MNQKAVYAYLSVKMNRSTMINKIENGLKNKDINFTKDVEVEEFQKGFLEHWDNLENFEPAAVDLKGLEGNELKLKKKELKNQFCSWISGEEAVAEGFQYAFEKKELMKEKIKGVGRSTASKVKAGMRAIVGEKKIGRNDPCSCGSEIKYKKCCGRP